MSIRSIDLLRECKFKHVDLSKLYDCLFSINAEEHLPQFEDLKISNESNDISEESVLEILKSIDFEKESNEIYEFYTEEELIEMKRI